jgi:hypothetical protein
MRKIHSLRVSHQENYIDTYEAIYLSMHYTNATFSASLEASWATHIIASHNMQYFIQIEHVPIHEWFFSRFYIISNECI